MIKYIFNHYLFLSSEDNTITVKATELSCNFTSLYRDRGEDNLAQAFPCLLTCHNNDDFYNWLIETGWGEDWGVFFFSDASISVLYSHFRKLLMVQTEEGEKLYFHFYLPQILRIFLPTCSKEQLGEFFGPINYFILEADDSNQALVFSLKSGQLHKEIISVEALQVAISQQSV
jgi:hypothetical protein